MENSQHLSAALAWERMNTYARAVAELCIEGRCAGDELKGKYLEAQALYLEIADAPPIGTGDID